MKKRKTYLLDDEVILKIKLLALKSNKSESKYMNDLLLDCILEIEENMEDSGYE